MTLFVKIIFFFILSFIMMTSMRNLKQKSNSNLIYSSSFVGEVFSRTVKRKDNGILSVFMIDNKSTVIFILHVQLIVMDVGVII